MDVNNIANAYRPIPFWSWNDKLDKEETISQVRLMHEAGIGGFFIHARGGLQTEYMSEEWFSNVEAAITEAEKYGMRPWVYDENGWPSGFGNGLVNGLGLEYQQKYLCMETTNDHTEHQICKSGNHYFYYEVNPFYVDVLDKKVVKEFITRIYDPYYDRFQNRIEGFFTDEPEVTSAGKIPWSFVFEEEYQKRYGENLLEHLEELFISVGEYKQTRIRFWKMITELFSESYFKQIYEWCDERKLKLTGHLVAEGGLKKQLIRNGACMPHYEYFHIPGMDWLGRKELPNDLTPYQVASVAEQFGKKEVLTESFAGCGHNVSLTELKGIYECQMVRGINRLCPHLQGYTIRGIRKRDWPPAMYYQQPWWSEYHKWIDAMSRIGMLLSEGKPNVDVLVLHPMTTAWSLFETNDVSELVTLDQSFLQIIRELEEKHISFHLGDEIILERHAKVKNGKLVIKNQEYSYIINSCCKELLDTTKTLLTEYERQGGQIGSVEQLAGNPVIEDSSITYTQRVFDEFRVHYFVNSSSDGKVSSVNVTGHKLDIYTGEKKPFNGLHRFEPWGSLVVLEDGTENQSIEEAAETEISLDGLYEVDENTLNTLVLDRCDYYFDGELQEENGYILSVCERANALERPVQIKMDFHVKVEVIPSALYLVTETPEIFDICINGIPIQKMDMGYYVDRSFRKIDVKDMLTIGENTITFECAFSQSQQFYENLRKAWKFRSEKNKLCYDMEIEAIYLVGKFSVKTDDRWEKLESDAWRYRGEFIIDAPRKSVSLSHIEQQGYPFFCGAMVLEGEVDVYGDNPCLLLPMKGINAIRIEMDGICKTILTEDRISLKNMKSGRKKIRLTLINNLRNLLGPHHLSAGGTNSVTPAMFYRERCVWNQKITEERLHWDEDYCFVTFGM